MNYIIHYLHYCVANLQVSFYLISIKYPKPHHHHYCIPPGFSCFIEKRDIILIIVSNKLKKKKRFSFPCLLFITGENEDLYWAFSKLLTEGPGVTTSNDISIADLIN